MFSETSANKITEIFLAAFDLAAEDRQKFLTENCDENLRREVESLFAARDAAGSFLEDLSAVAVVRNSFNRRGKFIGQKIDKYRIEKEIGRGGMGVVFLATREDFHQQVALKLIKRGMDSDAILDKFRREREILAALNHPFIARLLDGGTTGEGMPFFVMEYVEGVPVDEYCRANNLSEAKRLELFQKVCAAVSFAHQKLVVHRDLKPSNILVTKEGDPKLLDFGIAKLLDSTDEATKTEARALTPAYASPEQLRGEPVGTTSDAYSLGVILKELLTGGRPTQKAENEKWKSKSDEIKSEKQTNSNSPFCTGNSQLLKGDLQNILSKALRENAMRRYSSVEAFSDDLRRYLQGLPVTARADTFAYRTSKFIKRNRIGVGVAAVILLLLIGGAAATLWQFRQAQIERARAERRFSDVRALVNTFLSELNDEMAKVSGTTPARKLLVGRTLEYLDKVSQEAAGGDTSLERELATAYVKVGDIQGNSYYQNLGDTSGALASYQKALEIRERLAKENPTDAQMKSELAQTYESIGDVLSDKGDLNATLDNYSRATEVVEEVSVTMPDDVDTKLFLARLYAALGDVKYNGSLPSLKDMPSALDEQERALRIREQLRAASPEDKKININLDQSYERLAQTYRLKGDFAREFDFLQKSEAIVGKLLALDPESPNRKRAAAVCDTRLVTYFLDAGEFERADEYNQKSLALRQAMSNSDKTDARAQRDLAFGYFINGNLLAENGDARGALESYRRHLEIYEHLAALDASNRDRERDLVDGLTNVGDALLKTNDAKSALEQFNRALEIASIFPPDDLQTRSNLASIYEGIGSAALARGDAKAASENFEKAVTLHELEVENDNLNVIARAELAKIYFKAGAANEKVNKQVARVWYQKSLDVWNALQAQNVLRKIDLKNLEKTKRAFARVNLQIVC